MSANSRSTLVGDILVVHGVISLIPKHKADCRQRVTGGQIGEVVQDLGFITVSQLNAARIDQQWRCDQRAKASDPGVSRDAGN